MVYAAAAGAGMQALGGYLGNQAQQKSLNNARKYYSDIKAPDVEDLQYQAAMEGYVGDVNAPDIYLPPEIRSQMADISTDPRFASAQFDALRGYDDIIAGGGMTDMDRLNAQNAMQDASMASTRAQSDIQQDMARRGMSGGGQELLAKLAASQSNTNRASGQQQQIQAEARNRALQALSAKGGMAQGMQAQQFGQKAQIAQDQDSVNRFNTQLGVGQRNKQADMGFNAAVGNQAARQGVESRNTGSTNTSNQFNTGAHKDVFNANMKKAGALADIEAKKGNAQSDLYSGMGAGLGKVIGSFA